MLAKYWIVGGILVAGRWTNNFVSLAWQKEDVLVLDARDVLGTYRSQWNDAGPHEAILTVQQSSDNNEILLFTWTEGSTLTFNGLGIIKGNEVVVSYQPV